MMLKRRLIVYWTLVAALVLTACAQTTITGANDQADASLDTVTSHADKFSSDPAEIPGVGETTTAEKDSGNTTSDETDRPEGWQEDTHGKESEPNYNVVFPQDQVNQIKITINTEDWETMLADMTTLYGEFGSNPRRGMRAGQDRQKPPDGETAPIPGDRPVGDRDGNPEPGDLVPIGPPPEGGGPGWGPKMEGDDSNPMWVPVTISFEGNTWTQVGMRFKGNSSLRSTWGSGNYKLPFKLDFDEFEEQYPETDDQRFYGFKQLSFSSNFNDSSFLREKVAADLFREAGVPAAQTAFYQVYIDTGDGPVYFGLYTVVELVDDTLIDSQFKTDGGNIYKPSGTGAAFVQGTFSEASFDKENNQNEDDYSDIQALFQALNAGTRTSNPQAWRDGLEAVFDVDGFLNYLAVNTVIQNWDGYGNIAHNYYLYNNPSSGQLTWIPWDNNEAFKTGNMRSALSLSMAEVDSRWPLIRYLMDDPVYQAAYQEHIEAFIAGPFDPEVLTARFQELHELVQTSVIGPEGETAGYTHLRDARAFNTSLVELIQHVEERYEAAREYLESVK